MQVKYDVIITDGTVIDGTGKPGYRASVAVKDDRIAAVGPNLINESAYRKVDAGGKVVCPGFIDVHCHTDWNVLDGPWDSHQECQGVTTQIGGLCGMSPLSPREHLEKTAERGLGTNYALFAGHGTIREEVMGNENRKSTEQELDQMKALLERAMHQGALGLSTGLTYEPAVFSDTEELMEMVRVVGSFSGIYATHMRSEDDHIEEALEEAITIGRATGVPLHISHIKVTVPRNWGLATGILDRISREQGLGLKITADQYPYTVTGGGLYTAVQLVKDYDKETGFQKFQEQYQDPDTRNEMVKYAADAIFQRGGSVHFCVVRASQEEFVNVPLNKVLEQLGHTDPGAFIIDEIHRCDGEFAMIYHSISEKELVQFMQEPWVMAGTDGILGAFHPRTHGTFPRILGRYVREMQVLSLEEAIRKITSLPADTFGFTERGRLIPGAMADIVVFDPEEVIDNATMVEPTLYPKGIEQVFVNGVRVIENGQRTGAFPGMALKGNA